jgi:sortase A
MRRPLVIGIAIICLLAGGTLVADAAWIHTKALVAGVMIRSAWDDALASQGQPRPWPWADTWPVARLQAPDLGIDQIVLAGASGRTLAFGPGHVSGSALPNGEGNTVIGGHRDTHFRFLRDVGQGSRLVLTSPDGREVTYTVNGAEVVRSETLLPVDVPGRQLSLVTCWPFDSITAGGPERYVVTAIAEDSREIASPTRN